jgi:hypothetical protein
MFIRFDTIQQRKYGCRGIINPTVFGFRDIGVTVKCGRYFSWGRAFSLNFFLSMEGGWVNAPASRGLFSSSGRCPWGPTWLFHIRLYCLDFRKAPSIVCLLTVNILIKLFHRSMHQFRFTPFGFPYGMNRASDSLRRYLPVYRISVSIWYLWSLIRWHDQAVRQNRVASIF